MNTKRILSLLNKGGSFSSTKSGSGCSETGSNSGSEIFNKFLLNSETTTKAMINTLESDEKLKHKFSEYAEDTHNSENDLFLQQVISYKTRYPTKNDPWKINICLRIIKIYIEVNSAMQINISEEMRESILKEFKQCKVPKIDIFDKAFDEIGYILVNGAWVKFIKNEV